MITPLENLPRQNRCSLLTVARTAGVSAMTVSRVLRNSVHVDARTRKRVEVAVKKHGYAPDPHIANLMARVRGYRRSTSHAVIAVIRDDVPNDELHDPAYQYVSIGDIRRRATQHGYHAEEFYLGRGGMVPARLNGILRARGVDGIIVSPQSSRIIGTQFDYGSFAAATFGYGLLFPALHRASTNMMQGILTAIRHLSDRGYRRIGLAITQWIDVRADHTYSGALLHHQQQIPSRDRVPLLIVPDKLAAGRKLFCAWFRKHRPEVIISFHAYVPEWLTRDLGCRIPQDVGLVVHDWTENMVEFAGIHHRRPHVAGAAVDLVATQLMHNEYGIPEVPHQILIPASWIEGPSIRAARHR